MPNQVAIGEAFGRVPSILNWERCDFETRTLKYFTNRFRDTQYPRFIHIDLAKSIDSAGIACGYVPEFAKMDRGGGVIEKLPRIVFDFVLEVPPPKDGEINFEKIRTLLFKLISSGLPIRWASMDSFQSTDTLQLLRQRGICADIRSPDLKPIMYDVLKSAIIDGRVYLPAHDKAQKELRELERDAKTGKIIHPLRGSKDLADAITGVVFGLTWARATWAQHGINPSNIPMSITSAINIEAKGNLLKILS